MNRDIIREAAGLLVAILTTVLIMAFGYGWLGDMSSTPVVAALFAWLFVVMLWAAFGVVRHADGLAVLLGEPYGTLILTLSVISIEVVMISAVMLTGASNPTIGRDMMSEDMSATSGTPLVSSKRPNVRRSWLVIGSSPIIAMTIPSVALASPFKIEELMTDPMTTKAAK